MQTRYDIATHIAKKLSEHSEILKASYKISEKGIGYFFINDVLPETLALKLREVFPKSKDLTLKKSLREHKYVGAQMDNYDPILEETLYAFQDTRVVEQIENICGISNLQPDDNLYAGGLSLMEKDNFLNPHLDNSHDKDRDQWRVLNLLYYVNPDWNAENGGHLELWPDGLKNEQITIESTFNRLVVMATHQNSWHSVSPVMVDDARCCISNYYFSQNPLREEDRFHVTTFRGRPQEKLKNVILTVDSKLRMGLRKLFKKGVTKNPHVYKKDKNE